MIDLSFGFLGFIDGAVQAAIDHVIHLAIAAGNGNAGAYSPPRLNSLLSVGAIDSENLQGWFL